MKIGVDSNVLVASVKERGEPYHEYALQLARQISRNNGQSIASALTLLELPGAFASTTKMPIEKIYEVTVSVQADFNLTIMDFETYVERATDLIFEFRHLKSKWGIGSADFHHLATCIEEDCTFFVTTDERHLLREECRKGFQSHVRIIDPKEALETAV